MIELFLTYLLCVIVTRWYLRDDTDFVLPRLAEANCNPAVDEWNAREMVESESFYE